MSGPRRRPIPGSELGAADRATTPSEPDGDSCGDDVSGSRDGDGSERGAGGGADGAGGRGLVNPGLGVSPWQPTSRPPAANAPTRTSTAAAMTARQCQRNPLSSNLPNAARTRPPSSLTVIPVLSRAPSRRRPGSIVSVRANRRWLRPSDQGVPLPIFVRSRLHQVTFWWTLFCWAMTGTCIRSRPDCRRARTVFCPQATVQAHPAHVLPVPRLRVGLALADPDLLLGWLVPRSALVSECADALHAAILGAMVVRAAGRARVTPHAGE